ncbi:MAG: AAA family ATPase [Candidatus Micrarchaeota archaeon]
MSNLFKRLEGERGVFKEESALMPDYIPEVLPHREREVKEIASALMPASRGRKPENMILVGTPGTGKTACSRYVLRELAEYSKNVVPVYINCWEFSTRHGVLSEIVSALGEILPRRGISTDEITAKIVEVLKKEKKTPVVVLDELDRLFASQYGEEKVLYDLARAGEVFSVNIGVLGITNNKELLAKIDARVKSSLAQKQIEFGKYSPVQLKDILKERAKLSFFPLVLEEEVIPLCAAVGAKNNGDARLAIATLWKAGRNAEKEGKEKVSVEHAKEAANEANAELRKERADSLSEMEKKILEVLKKKGELMSSELYELLGESDRTVRFYLVRLEKSGLIETEEKIGKEGRTRKIKIKK